MYGGFAPSRGLFGGIAPRTPRRGGHFAAPLSTLPSSRGVPLHPLNQSGQITGSPGGFFGEDLRLTKTQAS